MKSIVLIRHGETNFLRDNPGSVRPNDDSLSKNGRLKAVSLAHRLSLLRPEIIVSSQLLRARETAKILAKARKLKCVFTSALNEFQVAPDGSKVERTEEGIARSIGFLAGLWPLYDRIAVVSHQSILSTILQFILNEQYANCKKRFKEPGSMVYIKYDWSRGDRCWAIVEPARKA